MRQYQEIKAQVPGALLFFRLGDFYEMFGQDAIEASRILGITLTARNKKTDPIPMCGVPHHSAENYIAKLTKAGKRVAICEQTSDPSLPGIVKREVVRVVTPGTSYNEQILNQKANQFVLSIFPKKDYFGIAYADLTTGEFHAAEISGVAALQSEILRLDPAEIILDAKDYDNPDMRVFMNELSSALLSPCDLFQDAHELLLDAFSIKSLEAFGLGSSPFAVQAAGLLMRYLQETQKEALGHINRITLVHHEDWMPLDEASIRNLELFRTLRGEDQNGTLLSVLDDTLTSMGGRCLRRWLLQPLLDKRAIEARHGAVAELMKEDDERHALIDQLQELLDLERLMGRLSGGSGNARDLVALSTSLKRIPHIKNLLRDNTAPLLKSIERELMPLDKLTDLLDKALLEDPAIKVREGGMIATGFHVELDELHTLMKEGKTALKNIESEEREKTRIDSLKVGFNKVFGYYIEITKTHHDKVPEHYIRKQTLVNAERYITPELKEFEEKVLGAEERVKALEYELFLDLREQTLRNVSTIKKNAQNVAQLDVLCSFARSALRLNYCQPQMQATRQLQIVDGRHPVVESITVEQSFVPNDTQFQNDVMELALITGPNMSGKSTYLRQVALIALMAQIGSFVPAKSAQLPVFDRIFTRVGASDNLVRGQSTFMVEMQEAAFILNHATDRSLIILDEIGRGTSTYDGLSIAWSMCEYLHEKIRAFTLFATHYHELIELMEKLPRAKNFAVDVQETKTGVLFLHKVKEGGIDRSYGIEVGKLAGLPPSLIKRAQEILHDLETGENHQHRPSPENQMDLFSQSRPLQAHPALERLQELQLDQMTPIQALNILDELKRLKSDAT